MCVKQASYHVPGQGHPMTWCAQALIPPGGEAQGTLHRLLFPIVTQWLLGLGSSETPPGYSPPADCALVGPHQKARARLRARRGTQQIAEACLKVEPGVGRVAGPVREAVSSHCRRWQSGAGRHGRGTCSQYLQARAAEALQEHVTLLTPISESFVNMMDNNLGCVKPMENIIPRSISPCNFVNRICLPEKKQVTFMLSDRYIFFDNFWGFLSSFERFTKAVPSYFKFPSLTFPLKIVLYFTLKSFNLPRIYFWAMQ